MLTPLGQNVKIITLKHKGHKNIGQFSISTFLCLAGLLTKPSLVPEHSGHKETYSGGSGGSQSPPRVTRKLQMRQELSLWTSNAGAPLVHIGTNNMLNPCIQPHQFTA